MQSSIKTIKYSKALSVIFFILTYFVCLNEEIGFLMINARWLSNTLFLTVFGGAFASMLVVMLCEIQKYLSGKINTENAMFYNGLYLYQFLFQMKSNIGDYLDNPDQELNEQFFDYSAQMIRQYIMALQGIEYVTYCKESSKMKLHSQLIRELSKNSHRILQAPNDLRIAYYTKRLSDEQTLNLDKRITSNSEPIHSILVAYTKRAQAMMETIDKYLSDLDEQCKKKYDWRMKKESMLKSYVSIFKAYNFEAVVKEGQ